MVIFGPLKKYIGKMNIQFDDKGVYFKFKVNSSKPHDVLQRQIELVNNKVLSIKQFSFSNSTIDVRYVGSDFYENKMTFTFNYLK